MRILVTGGTGFIGSHTICELLARGYEVVVIDNLLNSSISCLEKIKEITGKEVKFYKGNVQNKELLTSIFKENKIEGVIHFAGLKAVGESVKKPILYYDNNLSSTLTLIEVMSEFNCKNLVFSSSATVYGNPEKLPLTEDCRIGGTTNPYGTTKLMIEQILQDVYVSDPEWSIAILRYFNPIGAHPSGLIGENPNGIPNNLMPYIVKVATGELPKLQIFGNDYNTKDGTGVRDYIHVVDLAKGHIKAIEKINNKTGIDCYNLGTGIGYSVLDLVRTFQEVNQIEIPYEIVKRRPGDVEAIYANPDYAKKELGWSAKKSIEEMCRDSYNYILKTKK